MAEQAWSQAASAFAQRMLRLSMATLAAIVLCVALWPTAVQANTVLRVLAWPGYADPDIVAVFEKRYGVKVAVTTVASDEVLRGLLARTDGPGFDVVAANTAEISRMVLLGQLAPLPLKDIPNTSRQLPRFQALHSIAGITQGAQVYAIPFTYSEMGLIYDHRQFSTPPQSISVLWDARWRGKVLAFDSSSHAFSLAALRRGLPPFHIDGAQFSTMAKDLVALRRNVRAFYSLPEESLELFRTHRVAVMHANYGQQQFKQLRDAGLDVGYIVPREGALAWLDCWAITRRSSHAALAAQWIDFMLDPTVSRQLTKRQGLANTLDEPLALSDAAQVGPIIWLQPVEDEIRRAQLWRRVLSGDRPDRF